MNGVCTNIIHLHKDGLQYYRVGVALSRSIYSNTGLHIYIHVVTLCLCVMSLHCQGNYDAYVKTRSELEEHQTKRYQWETDQMQHMKVPSARPNPLTLAQRTPLQ